MRNHEPYNDIEVKSKPKSKKWIKAAAAAALIARLLLVRGAKDGRRR